MDDKQNKIKEDIEYYTDYIKHNYGGKDIDLDEIEENLPEMKKLSVSIKCRSKDGFIKALQEVGGDYEKLSDDWKLARLHFLSRTIPQFYGRQRTLRRYLSLIAWGYKPEAQKPEFKRKVKRKPYIREKPVEKKDEVKEEKQEEKKE